MNLESISLLKKENAKLQKELDFSRALLESANSIVIRWDKDGIIQYMNDFGLRFFGYSVEELIGQHLLTIVPKVEKNTGRDMSMLAKDIVKNPDHYKSVPSENITKDGRTVWVTWTNKGFFDEQGNVQEILAIGNDITGLKQAEMSLWEYQRKLDSALESMDDAVFISDSQGTFVHFNKAFATFHKFKDKSECLRHLEDYPKVLDVFLPDGERLPLDQWVVARALRGETDTNAEYSLHRKDTGETWIGSYSFGPFFDQHGNIAGAVMVARDITLSKLAEEELKNAVAEKSSSEALLQASEAQTRAMLEQAPMGIALIDSLSGKLYEINQRFAEIVGRSREDLLALDWMTITHPDDIQPDLDNMTRLNAGEISSFNMQKRYIHADTSAVWVSLTVAPIEVSEKNRPRHLAMVEDITEKKQAEEALRKSNQDLRLAQRIAHIGNWTLDPEVGVPVWSDEVYRIYERDPSLDPYTLADYKNIFKEEWLEKFTSAIQGAVHEGQPYELELKLELAPDNIKWVHAICEPEGELGTKGYCLRGTIQDITERKQAEQEREDLEAQLRQKYKMEAVGVMAGGMAHNFNNSLAIILGNLELSERKISPQSEILKNLDYAKIAALRARDLVKQVMTYSRKDIQSQKPLQLSLLLKETLTLLKSTIPSSVKLRQDVSPDCENTYIQADASQIQECLINLCNNSVHAMNEQGELFVRLERANLKQEDIPAPFNCPPGDYLCLCVQDNGCGISAEIREKIFDPFFTTKKMYEGTGMGLSTVQGIVMQHHGMIAVKGDVGQETIFNLYFPVVDQPETGESEIAAATELLRGSERILFVDDDQMVTNLYKLVLSELGYQVTVCTDSVEALKLFSTNVDNFDLIITDQTMPELNGSELIQKIKKLRPEMPTILCTGYSNKVNEEGARQAGASAFLMKPIDFSELSQVIRTVLEKPSA